jgi:cell division protein ZapA
MKSSVEVKIAGRKYPVTVKASEEDNLMRAAAMINKQVEQFENSFAVKDKQDLLAMSALQIIAGQLSIHTELSTDQNSVAQTVTDLESFVSSYLKKVK